MTNSKTKKALKERHYVIKNSQGKFFNIGSRMFDFKFNSMKHIYVDQVKITEAFHWYCCSKCDDLYDCKHGYTIEEITWTPTFVRQTGE